MFHHVLTFGVVKFGFPTFVIIKDFFISYLIVSCNLFYVNDFFTSKMLFIYVILSEKEFEYTYLLNTVTVSDFLSDFYLTKTECSFCLYFAIMKLKKKDFHWEHNFSNFITVNNM